MRDLTDIRTPDVRSSINYYSGAGHDVIAQKMANDLSVFKQLRQTCHPVNPGAVDAADEVRKLNRRIVRENKSGPEVESLRPGLLKPGRTGDAK